MKVTLLKPFGAQVTDMDVNSPEHMNSIRELLWANGVVVLPAGASRKGTQPVHDDASISALGKLFGEPDSYHPVNPTTSATSDVQVLQTRGNSGIPADSFLFHSDISWRVNPPRASVLCAHQLPPKGGDTSFQNTNIMYNRLSAELKDKVSRLTFNHSLKEGYSRVNRADDVSGDRTATHPGVIVHPESGAPLLYVNNNFTVDCMDMDSAESDTLLENIFEQAYSDECTLTHKWSLHDVVIWDNLGTQHKASDDYSELRTMHRIVASDKRLRLERHVSKDVTVEDSIDALNFLLQDEDNKSAYTEYANRYDRDMVKAEYIVPLIATDLLARYVKKTWRDSEEVQPLILDIAAGTGRNAIHLAQNHRLVNIEAMEQTEGMLHEARRRELYRKYYIANANKTFPMEANVYDVVICVGGLAKCQIRPEPAIANMVLVTKPGGFVLITMQSASVEYINVVEKLARQGAIEVEDVEKFIGIRTMPTVEHSAYILRVL